MASFDKLAGETLPSQFEPRSQGVGETRLGLRLLHRTIHSVATTEAGERLLRDIAPHFDGIEAGLAALTELREKPAGTVRISVGDQPAESILLPALSKLLPRYPDLNVEISVNSGFVDIVAERFDAGVRLGETIAQDMVALRIGPDMRMAVVGSPAYFADRPLPRTPQDLAGHVCINLRYTSEGGIAVWEFEQAGRTINVRVEGQLLVVCRRRADPLRRMIHGLPRNLPARLRSAAAPGADRARAARRRAARRRHPQRYAGRHKVAAVHLHQIESPSASTVGVIPFAEA